MKITKRTMACDVVPLLNEKRIAELLERVPAVPLQKHVTGMTIAEFAAVTDGELPEEVTNERYALRYIGKIRTLMDELKSVGEYVKKMRPTLSEDEKKASSGVDFPTAVERMLLDVAKFFALRSFEEAERVKVAEWMLIAKDAAATAKYERNLARIHSGKKGGGK